MGCVQLDAVVARLARATRTLAVHLDHAFDLFGSDLPARLLCGLGADHRRPHRLDLLEEGREGLGAGMRELGLHLDAVIVDQVHQLPVSFDLVVAVKAERVLLIPVVGVDAAHLETDQPGAASSTLVIIRELAIRGSLIVETIVDGHRSHDDTIGKLHRADLDGTEESVEFGHLFFLA